ncbi:MAG: GNAT family N-acetyltransferase [Candidatus Babeliales bacterium]
MKYKITMVLALFLPALHASPIYKHLVIDTGLFYNETKIGCSIDNTEVGFLKYTKAPFLSYYVLHTLYVHPEYRKQGYGTQLLAYACDYLKALGAQKIYVQPGPFEIVPDGNIFKTEDVSGEKLKALVSFYQKNGFTKAHAALMCCALMAYYCISLDEDANYLMVKI